MNTDPLEIGLFADGADEGAGADADGGKERAVAEEGARTVCAWAAGIPVGMGAAFVGGLEPEACGMK